MAVNSLKCLLVFNMEWFVRNIIKILSEKYGKLQGLLNVLTLTIACIPMVLVVVCK